MPRSMIYTFKSKAAADLKMTGPVGDRVLALIGKAPGVPGILEPGRIPAALQALEAAVAAESPTPADRDDDGPAPAGGDTVSLRRRVWPFVEMMKRAQAAREPIVWGV